MGCRSRRRARARTGPTDAGARATSEAGSTNSFYSGQAKFQGTLGLTYREGPWTLGGQVRITGESIIDAGTQGRAGLSYVRPTYVRTGGVDVASVSAGQRGDGILETNYNAMELPIDLRAQYRWNNNITLFAAIDNVQNLPTDTVLRRAYRFGVRFSY